jgi:hypothetical protein
MLCLREIDYIKQVIGWLYFLTPSFAMGSSTNLPLAYIVLLGDDMRLAKLYNLRAIRLNAISSTFLRSV